MDEDDSFELHSNALKAAIVTKSFQCLQKVVEAMNQVFIKLTSTPLPLNRLHEVHHKILDQCYSTAVAPQANRLKKYAPASDAVYGELLPTLVDKIIETTHITSKSLFLDLGSGVGHVVMQVSLRTGCRSFGIENAVNPSELAAISTDQLSIRSHMWGVALGGQIILEQGDMTRSRQVFCLLQEADVVLINNKCFSTQCSACFESSNRLLTSFSQ